MRRKDQPPYSFPARLDYWTWSGSAWASSEARKLLNGVGRGIYRELLDTCYLQGTILNPEFDPLYAEALARDCAVSLEDFQATWKMIKRYFNATKKDPSRLCNSRADLVRRQFFKFIEKQRSDRLTTIAKTGDSQVRKESTTSASKLQASSKLAPSQPQASRESTELNRTEENRREEFLHSSASLQSEEISERALLSGTPDTARENMPSGPRAVPLRTPDAALEAEWLDVRTEAAQYSISGSEADWNKAKPIYFAMDVSERLVSRKGFTFRTPSAEQDPRYWTRPQKYFEEKQWQRFEGMKKPASSTKRPKLLIGENGDCYLETSNNRGRHG